MRRYGGDVKKFVKPLLALAALIVVLVVIFTYFPDANLTPKTEQSGSSNTGSTTQPNTNSSPKPSLSPSPSPSLSPSQQPVSASIPRPSGATLSHVAFVHDGDTLFLQPEGTHSRDDQIKVRLIGLDTPEIGEYGECFGTQARDYLRGVLPKGTAVWTMPDREEFDKYGRSLLYLWTMDDRSVNLDLVEKGYATALNIAPSNSYWKQFDAAEDAAYKAGLGLWKACYS